MTCTDCTSAIKHTHERTTMPEIKPNPRVPRPLTDAERRKLRKRAGGDAKPEQLAKLEEAFGKPAKDRERKEHADSARRHRNNGWQR